MVALEGTDKYKNQSYRKGICETLQSDPDVSDEVTFKLRIDGQRVSHTNTLLNIQERGDNMCKGLEVGEEAQYVLKEKEKQIRVSGKIGRDIE